MHWSYHSNPTWSYKKHYRTPGNKTKSEPTDGVATMTLHTDEWKGDRSANYARMYHRSGHVDIETVVLGGMLTPPAKRSMGKISAINLYRMLIRQPATGGYAGIDTQHGEWFILHLRRFTPLYREKIPLHSIKNCKLALGLYDFFLEQIPERYIWLIANSCIWCFF